MNTTTKWALIVAGLYWAFKSFGKGAIDSQIRNSFMNAGFNSDNAKWWAAVSRFETGNYTSELAIKYNNYFGMTSPGQTGVNLGKASTTNFLKYASVQDSVNDVIAWVTRNNLSKQYPTLSTLIAAMADNHYFTEDRVIYFNGVTADLIKVL